MRVLDVKLLRDFARLWPQALAIALVVAGGVASLVLAVGSFRSLDETRGAYYERHRFADDLRAPDKEAVCALEAAKYASDDWTFRRPAPLPSSR